MKKEYRKPEVEMISLITEAVTTEFEGAEGDMDVESNTLFD